MHVRELAIRAKCLAPVSLTTRGMIIKNGFYKSVGICPETRPGLCWIGLVVLLAGFAGTSTAVAGLTAADLPTNEVTGMAPPAAASGDYVSGMVNLEFSNYHLTPRGINLQDKGLIFQPTARLDWTLYRARQTTNAVLDSVGLGTGLFNDFDTVRSGANPGSWNEIDFILGPNATFYRDWKFESPFISFKSETGSYPTCWAWNPRLTCHDHWLRDFSVNPYVEFFDELQNKVTVVLVPAQSRSSYYGVLGMDPTYASEKLPLILELPTYILIPGADFYQRANGSGGGTGLGLFSTSLRATVPLKFLGTSGGKWSLYAGVQYDYLNNPGLLDGNLVVASTPDRQRDLVVFHGGITVRF